MVAEQKNKESLNRALMRINKLKHNQIVRLICAPAVQAGYLLGDWRYRHSQDSEKIRSLHNSHAGERCFIVGNGPSLRPEDLSCLKDEFTFAANRVFKLFGETEWRPTVFLAMDKEMIAQEAEVLAAMPAREILIAKTSFSSALQGHATFLNVRSRYYTLKKYSNRQVAFSSKPDLVIYSGFTITFVALQLALYMGFKEIYLLGMDHTYKRWVAPDGVVHFNQDAVDHCFEDPKDAIINLQPKHGVELAYHLALEEAKKRGARIVNATRGGALTVFERADLDDILDQIKTRKAVS